VDMSLPLFKIGGNLTVIIVPDGSTAPFCYTGLSLYDAKACTEKGKKR